MESATYGGSDNTCLPLFTVFTATDYQVDRNIENLEIMQGTSSVIVLPVSRFIWDPDIWLWINTYKYNF